jgi:hypothetical protein
MVERVVVLLEAIEVKACEHALPAHRRRLRRPRRGLAAADIAPTCQIKRAPVELELYLGAGA